MRERSPLELLVWFVIFLACLVVIVKLVENL